MNLSNILKLFLLIVIAEKSTAVTDRIVCYYRSWTYYNGIKPSDFNANLCTHVNYAFILIAEDGSLTPSDNSLDVQKGLYKQVTDMKKQNPGLKVLISIGGGTAQQTQRFASVAADPVKRAKFISTSRKYVQNYGFDGVDLDWEYPEAKDKQNFNTLVTEIKQNLNGLLVTTAVSSVVQDGYDVPHLSQTLDFINVMSYDFYGPWSSYTGQNSALYASPVESDWEKSHLNVAASANSWRSAGANAYKLSIGAAFYGRSFKLSDPNQHGIHAPISGSGVGTDGALNYAEICSKYQSWTKVFDENQKNPYKYNGDQWFGYDDQQSIALKTQYIKSQNYGGLIIWAIDGDDVHGTCGEKQILLKTINNSLK